MDEPMGFQDFNQNLAFGFVSSSGLFTPLDESIGKFYLIRYDYSNYLSDSRERKKTYLEIEDITASSNELNR